MIELSTERATEELDRQIAMLRGELVEEPMEWAMIWGVAAALEADLLALACEVPRDQLRAVSENPTRDQRQAAMDVMTVLLQRRRRELATDR